jgi:hypothetical protein
VGYYSSAGRPIFPQKPILDKKQLNQTFLML